ncbi:succinate dehydrogenase cytochrome b subunit [Psychroflexus sp. YR1-1]|uniref:Succinate dehydrogenase cytochrome b subunit n=1 Tax=Psychroflexus aurantiacus TaxID=2709310 RepID=A0A6B3R2Q5_9FLAO|nr:succinate dehydrogenase cytochrome b subunit [Psychroflexus aurantiacus]NEV93015.1 succinate dehydrogenase cytochrome b subunit [Psychroflexus aurantiacus]
MAGISKTSIARKVAMALSGLFLVLFLAQHFTINFTSVVSPSTFNEISHFMGTNFVVQAILQPILIAGVVFHFVMGFVLEIRNSKARKIKYNKYNGAANSTWMSRNMIISGIVVLAFLGLHFYDFWIPELVHKYVESHPDDPTRYYDETIAKFAGDPIRTGLYALSFIFLMLHLLHGFASSFQSLGTKNKYQEGLGGYKSGTSRFIRKFTTAFAVVIPMGFVFIALYHYFNNL